MPANMTTSIPVCNATFSIIISPYLSWGGLTSPLRTIRSCSPHQKVEIVEGLLSLAVGGGYLWHNPLVSVGLILFQYRHVTHWLLVRFGMSAPCCYRYKARYVGSFNQPLVWGGWMKNAMDSSLFLELD